MFLKSLPPLFSRLPIQYSIRGERWMKVKIQNNKSWSDYLTLPCSHELHLLSPLKSRCRHATDSIFVHILVFGFGFRQHPFVSTPEATVIKAYQFSSITSVTLLDCWTVPWAIILTWIFIGTRYSLWQLLGAATCVVGLGLVLLSDAGVSGGGGNKPLLGDSLVIAGTFFYAISNVGEEYCVKKKDRVEVVAMLGIFGVIVSVCQIFIFEKKDLEAVKWSAEIISLFVGFAMSTFLFYTIAPFVLKMGGATIFNLSLLTSDMWVVLIRIFFYGQQVDWLYYFSFVVVALGLIIYSLTSSNPATAVGDEEVNGCYEQLNEENAESRNEVQTTERGTSES
ncbi:uncharacterized protein LOC143877562 isoform X2 [Tasmannia lanceolata]|uniref:uncharacterized protein LOC143877562 isoform X2 n=1 Tax=Tasmannia lanceolata TaxID=3420 RepID=UPI0040636ACA